MKHILFLLFSLTVFFYGCDGSQEGDLAREAIKDKFNGKYEIVSAISEIPVDLNMDGERSTDLFSENEAILSSEIVLNIYDDVNLFTEHWPIEYIAIPTGEELDSAMYNPSFSIEYARYAITSSFSFSENQDIISLINPEQIRNNGIIDTRFIFPTSIIVESDGTLVLTSERNFYTFDGYITSQVIAKYKRYTKQT